jgi:NAD(P)-dependent dehydrogenase (short-subunit alcohol dehydrogenase family)
MSAATQPRTVVITGCTRGIGRALVDELVRLGQRVAGCGRSAEHVAELARAHPGGLFQAVDVRDDAAVGRFARAVLDAFGAPDLVINNAALINRNAPLWKVPASEFSDVVDVNVKGVASVVRHFAPAMVERASGVIVNVSSGWGRSADAEVAPYCATKFAVEGLSQSLAQELPRGMACVALSPGVVDTDMLRSAMGGGASRAPSPERWAKRAAPVLLALGPRDNGTSIDVTG